jgi:hypothetical protein
VKIAIRHPKAEAKHHVGTDSATRSYYFLCIPAYCLPL